MLMKLLAEIRKLINENIPYKCGFQFHIRKECFWFIRFLQ
jgi:hypothetical protein